MKRNILNSFFLLFMLSLVVACKTKKKVVVTVPPVPETPVAQNVKSETLELLKSKDVSYNTLILRGKAKIDFNGNVNNVNMNIRIKKDEGIWFSVTAFAGIEAARALITPDSIKVMNKLQSTYVNQPFAYVHRFTNQQVDFKLLQAILSGNTIGDFMQERADLKQENGVWLLSGAQGDLAYRVLFNTLLKVSENNLNDIRSGQALKVVYGDYQQMEGSLFPTSMTINSVAGRQKVDVNIDFSKVESNVPVDFPFNVPKKYEVIN